MSAYLTVAVGTVFVSALCAILIPEGRLKGTITFIMRLLCLAALAAPLKNFIQYDFNQQQSWVDYSFLCEAYAEDQERALESALKKQTGVDCECEITIVYNNGNFEQSAVQVNVMTEDSQVLSLIYEYLTELNYINITVI